MVHVFGFGIFVVDKDELLGMLLSNPNTKPSAGLWEDR